MSDSGTVSKVAILLEINKLHETGEVDRAKFLQRILLDSMKNDKKVGRYSPYVECDEGMRRKMIAGS